MKIKQLDYSFERIKTQKEFKVIDILKFFFACLVVYMHTSPLHKVEPHLNFLIINGFSKLIVPFFFTCSGFFLFRKVNMSPLDFLKYLKRVVILFIIWNIIYNIFGYFIMGEKVTLNSFLFSFFFTSSPLWYIDALIKSITILYILSRYFTWKRITLFFFLVTFLIYCPTNFYVDKINGISKFYDVIKPLNYLRISSIFFVALGALFANFDLKNLYKGKKINTIIVLLIIGLLTESALFKYMSIRNNDTHRHVEYYFTLPFLMFFLFFRVITLEITEPIKNILMRKYSSIIYFSHHCFKIIFNSVALAFTASILIDVLRFTVVLAASLAFSFILCKVERTRIGKFSKYLY